MPDYYSPEERTESTLADHLTRLRRTFSVIATRLREAVTQAIGQTVSRIVQQVLGSFLSRSPPGPEPPLDDWAASRDPDSLWEEVIQDRHWREKLITEPEYDHRPFPSPELSLPVSDLSSVNDQPSVWRRVTVLVCRLAAWWLQRRRWPYPVVTALSVGLMAGVAAYAGGPVVAAGTAMSLATLTDLVDSGVVLALRGLP